MKTDRLSPTFAALTDPARRAILARRCEMTMTSKLSSGNGTAWASVRE